MDHGRVGPDACPHRQPGQSLVNRALAHPRTHGEHASKYVGRNGWRASSPHARGALSIVRGGRDQIGLIPARAGSTSWRNASHRSRRAHPRTRGEHHLMSVAARPRLGSSPRARGARRAPGAASPCRGLIPARAGSTQVPQREPLGDGAHPRTRGEHPALLDTPAAVRGSSPHARGALLVGGDSDRPVGLIPARAGSTLQRNPLK